MNSRTTQRFRKALAVLPEDVRTRARLAYRLFASDPWHAALQFKQVHPSEPIYSVRVGLGYRALGIRQDETVIWFWIGSHAEYDRLVTQR
ncbi:MAG: hypothetical protein U0104_05755 [Gemmatimonadales bacterium]